MDEEDVCERTCYVSNLHESVTQAILEEMFIQMGPIEKVILNTKNSYRYSLVIFKDVESVIFASQCLDKIPLYGMEISVRPKGHTMQEEKYKKLLAKAARESQMSFNLPTCARFDKFMPATQQSGFYAKSQSDRRDVRNRGKPHDERNRRSFQDKFVVSSSSAQFVPGYAKEKRASVHHQTLPYTRTPVSHRQSSRFDTNGNPTGKFDRFSRRGSAYDQLNPVPFLNLPSDNVSWRQIPRDTNFPLQNPQTPNLWNNNYHQPFHSKSYPRYQRF